MGMCAATLFTTYHVPSGTSRAKSGPVFAARTTTTVDLLVAGSAGPNAARNMPNVHDMTDVIQKTDIHLNLSLIHI